ncbi:UDP-glycosyltransferase 72B1-like [Panicum virgatum]|uniref:UDP-glycosyltransferase 72B1-like n=1 Tax=Panicum virgatum TaxID=38727 RepID=UPI0019D609E7|nr:UDP-glycosyltransferase 72B1-like [Panicum virgatum]
MAVVEQRRRSAGVCVLAAGAATAYRNRHKKDQGGNMVLTEGLKWRILQCRMAGVEIRWRCLTELVGEVFAGRLRASDPHERVLRRDAKPGRWFAERTRAVGLVVPEWGPHVEILGHRTVGGFLTHCGWNSALEAMAAGVPALAWSLFAELRMNAVKLASEHVGLALRASSRADGVVPREEVATAAKELMVGEKGAVARERARELRAEARKASVPGGPAGPAHQALAALVDRWKCAAASPAVNDAAGGGL